MDFVFDRAAEWRVLKCLTVVDDATYEAVAIEPERAISQTDGYEISYINSGL